MKICLVSRRFDSSSGSAEWIYADWLRKKLIKNKIEVLAIEQKGAAMNSPLILKILYDVFVLPFRLLHCRIAKKADVFHFLGENQGIYSFMLRILGAKTFIECYDLMRIKNREPCLDKFYFYGVYKMLNLSNRIIAISTSTKEDISNILGINSKKIEVIPPIYRDFNPKNRKSMKKIIGYLGALGGRKRADELLNMAKIIKGKKIKNMVISIYSGRGEDKKLQEGARKLSSIIKIHGAAKEEDLEKIYNSFDFFVFPSEYEGLGLPIIEAMMCGKPCFILEDSYFPKEVSEGCIKCSDSEEILYKITELQKKGYKSAAKKSLEYSKRFSSGANFNKLIKLYKNQHEK